MTKLIRSATILFLFFTFNFVASSWAQTASPVAEKIAKTYGLDSYGQIEAVRYTWSIDIPGLFKATHKWEWEPKTGKVSFESTDKDGKPVRASYVRFQPNAQNDAVKTQIEPAFVNDNYWLLFPLHAYWDTAAKVTDQGVKKLPIGGGSARLISVKYPAEVGGYTPGDTWDLYVGKDGRVQQFVYHRGGDKKPKLVRATWAGYKKAGPLLVSGDHKGTADGKPFTLTITDVAVKLTGSDKWVNAQ
jgi:hypothetical protein